jgi:tetratricopeptide (TPR) repeat protein
MSLGDLAWHQGRPADAEPRLQEALKRFRQVKDPLGCAQVLTSLGQMARVQGAWEQARTWFKESLELLRSIGNQRELVMSLEGLAGVLSEQGHLERAAQLFGRAAALREALGAPGSAYERQVAVGDLERLRVSLGEEGFVRGMNAGRALALDQVPEVLWPSQARD